MWELVIGGALLLAVGFGTWLALNQAKERGRAEAERDASEDARKVEQEMTDITLQPTSPAETKDKLKKGEF